MMTVAESSAVPIIPMPRGRFTALTVGIDASHITGLTPKLRSLGAASVHRTATARGGNVPPPVGPHDVCVVEASGHEVREELRCVIRSGWRRVVVVTTRTELVRDAIGVGARSAIVPRAQPKGPVSADPIRANHAGGAATMSQREIQVLQCVSEGQTNRQIGDRLCLSSLTVKSHLARIGRKLGTGDRAEMVAIGIRHGVVA